jgi:hypothetical protein
MMSPLRSESARVSGGNLVIENQIASFEGNMVISDISTKYIHT